VSSTRTEFQRQSVTLTRVNSTFRTLAREGKKGFYTGRIAQEIVNLIQSGKGVMSLEDLAAHDTQFVEPISIDYEDITVWECPPNGQGIAALIALGVIKELRKNGIVDIEKLEHNSAEYLHVLIEALRIAFADARHYVADPDVVDVPTKALLDEKYLEERAKLFLPDKSNPHIKKGYPTHNSGTVYFSVVDDYGNACSFIVRNSNHDRLVNLIINP
jgi:gamma-glutamyltranspeptidase/glutathione hydrolase